MKSDLFSEYRVDLGILILRVAVGAVVFTHGLLKPLVFTLSGTMEFFEKNGFTGRYCEGLDDTRSTDFGHARI
jgi:hypothetical protein